MDERVKQIAQTIEALSASFPADQIATRPQGGRQIAYLEWHTVVKRLNETCPDWDCCIDEVKQVENMVTVRVTLTIGVVSRSNIGFESLAVDGYGDPFSNAFAMALKRAAALFGVGLELYDKEYKLQSAASAAPWKDKGDDEDYTPTNFSGAPPKTKPPTVSAANAGKALSDKQKAAIYAICKGSGLDADAEAFEGYNCLLADLTVKQASEMIDNLKGRAARVGGR